MKNDTWSINASYDKTVYDNIKNTISTELREPCFGITTNISFYKPTEYCGGIHIRHWHRHRENKPAMIDYHQHGIISRECYYYYGHLHRLH